MQLFDMDNYPKLKHYNPIIVTPEFVARFEAKLFVTTACLTAAIYGLVSILHIYFLVLAKRQHARRCC
jgi:hypothetical protein